MPSHPSRSRPEISRRHFLGHLAATGLGIPAMQFFASLGANADQVRKNHRSCILLWMSGGPSHLDIWDLKPESEKNAGPFRPIATSAEGVQISEHLPRVAKQMHHLNMARSPLPRPISSRSRASASHALCFGWTVTSARISYGPEEANPCCGSTYSGCSATPGFTRSFCRPWAWCLTGCRRSAVDRLVGYTPVALATVSTMILGFGVWVHHMFTTGLPSLSLSFFSAASIIITVPSAVAVFAWTATIWLAAQY